MDVIWNRNYSTIFVWLTYHNTLFVVSVADINYAALSKPFAVDGSFRIIPIRFDHSLLTAFFTSVSILYHKS